MSLLSSAAEPGQAAKSESALEYLAGLLGEFSVLHTLHGWSFNQANQIT